MDLGGRGGAIAYRVQLSEDEEFTEEDPVTPVVEGTSYRQGELEPGATRYLRVASVVGCRRRSRR